MQNHEKQNILRFKSPEYSYNVTYLKNYNNKKIRVITLKAVRNSWLEDCSRTYTEKGTVNEEKLQENIARARSKIYEYSICNEWDLFCTFTLDKNKYNRYDLEKFRKDFSQWIRNNNKKYKCTIKYLVIPEMHKDGAWHMHGFLMGVPNEQLREFTLKEKLPKYIKDKLTNNYKVYEWVDYREKFGFNDLEPIRNQDAAAKYVTKYISKELANSVKELNSHLYYCSQGLKQANLIKKGTISKDIAPSFSNEYCKVTDFQYSSDLLNKLSLEIL